MKTIKFIGMALFAILMCVNFTSCSNDDLITTKGKKLTKIERNDWYGEYTYLLNFDKKRRLIGVKEINNKKKTDSYYSYTWNNNTIIGCNNSYVCNIEKGLIKNINEINGEYNETFLYDDSKKIINYIWEAPEYNESTSTPFIWENEKLTELYLWYNGNCQTNYTFSYDGIFCKKGCFHPFILVLTEDFWMNDFFLNLVHPELLGIQTTQLPTKMSRDDCDYVFEYEFDKDGYVSKIIKDNFDTYTLTWE